MRKQAHKQSCDPSPLNLQEEMKKCFSQISCLELLSVFPIQTVQAARRRKNWKVEELIWIQPIIYKDSADDK